MRLTRIIVSVSLNPSTKPSRLTFFFVRFVLLQIQNDIYFFNITSGPFVEYPG
jgi:hypothetical protein